MHIAFIVASALLAVEMAATGIPKALQLNAVRASAEHLGVSLSLDRMIGLAEIAAAVGLLTGLALPALSIVTGAAVLLLMCGAVSYHLKARDNITAMLPAVVTAALSVAVVLLAASQGTLVPSL